MDIVSLIRQRATEQPDRIAYHCRDAGDALTYRTLVARAEAAAHLLLARGAKPFDRCGVLIPEGPDFLVNALGVLFAGLTVAPLSWTLSPAEVDFVIHGACLHWLQREKTLDHYPLQSALDGSDDASYRATQPAYIRFTSGTTGKRKGVLLGHPTVRDRLMVADEILRITPSDRIWFQLPMADHFVVSILLYLSRGASIYAFRNQQRQNWINLAREVEPTVIYGSPAFYADLTEAGVAALPQVRLAIATTASLPFRVQARFKSRFGCALNPALGIIEAGLLTLQTEEGRPDSVGRPMPAYRITVPGEQGPGQIGELHVAGPGLLDAYLMPWRPRASLLTPAGLPTGDFGWLDRDGFLYLVGRGKNRLQIEGLTFFSEEIERVINALPGVSESRVYLEPKSRELKAEIVGVPECLSTLPGLLQEKLDSRQIPSEFRRVSALPRTANGKLLRQ